MGRRVFFAADVAVAITAGSNPFRIPLSLHPETIKGLLAKVLAIQPVGLLPAVVATASLGLLPGSQWQVSGWWVAVVLGAAAPCGVHSLNLQGRHRPVVQHLCLCSPIMRVW